MRKLIINDNLRRSQALRIFYGHAISRILIWSFFFKINLSSLKISWYKCFGLPNFRLWIHNKLQHKTHETVDEIGMPKFSPKFDH